MLRACWQQCRSENEDNNAQIKICRKIKSVGGTLIFVGLRRRLWKSRAIRDLTTKKKCCHTSPTHHNWYVHHPSSTYKIWTLRQSANTMSPPTLHILNTWTIHHVCTQRTPRSTRDTTTIPMTVNDFHFQHKKTLGNNTVPPPHCENRSSMCPSSTFQRARFQQKFSCRITCHLSHWKSKARMVRNTPRSHNTAIRKHVLHDFNHQPNQPTNFHWIVAGCFMHVDKSIHHHKHKKNTQPRSRAHSIHPQLTPWFALGPSVYSSNRSKFAISQIPCPTCPSSIYQRIQFEHKLIRKTTNHLRHWTPSTGPRGYTGMPITLCSQKWYHALQLSTRSNEKKMPQQHPTTPPRQPLLKCVHHPLKFTHRTTCHLVHWTSSSRKQYNLTQDCEYVKRCVGETKLSTTTLSSPMLARMRITRTRNNTT